MAMMPLEESELRRGSLRRLGSFANANFNPFSRRRSQVSDTMTIASNKSTVSIPAVPSETSCLHASTASLVPSTQEHDVIKQPTLTSSFRRRSYIALPDDTSHALPKHRTMSNLPLPAKTQRPLSFPKPVSSALLPPSRIPTPAKTELRSRLSVGTKVLKPVKYKGLQRSDTEPLLSELKSNPGRSTAFKENLTLSPIKPLPDMTIFTDATPTLADTPKVPRQSSWFTQQNPAPLKTPVTGLRMRGASAKLMPNSSPIRKPSTNTSSTSELVPNRKSQPVLAERSHNVASKRASHGPGIKQHQLLTPRQPPTPPVTTTPLRHVTPAAQRTTRREPVKHAERPQGSETVDGPCFPPVFNPDSISQREPVEYWCGRMSQLTDRYRNERFIHCLEEGQPAHLENEQETHERTRRAMAHLYSVCVTEEARASFRVSEDVLLEFLHHPLSESFDTYQADVAESDSEEEGAEEKGYMAFI